MAYIVSNDFKEKLYSGECDYRATLIINGNTIPNEQIASISISSPIVDDTNEMFYVGTFISQKITIKFNNLDGLSLESGQNVSLSIGQYVNNAWVDVPIGLFIVDDLGENYQKTCEITCMDYGVKFKPNIDYSPCFVDGKATIDTILQYICTQFGVTLGDYPTINGDVEIGTYDSTISGKQWISYIAEIKGCNAKIDREGRLTLQPLKQASNQVKDATQNASFELGEKYNVSKVTYTDAIRNYTYGDDSGNTLFIRQDNPFVSDDVVKNIYLNVLTQEISETNTNMKLDDMADNMPLEISPIYGNTYQEQIEANKNLLVIPSFSNYTSNGITFSYSKGVLTYSGTATSNFAYIGDFVDLVLPVAQYTFSTDQVIDGATPRITIKYSSSSSTIQTISKTTLRKTFTTRQQTQQIRLGLSGITSGNTYSGTLKLQLEQNSTSTSWVEPQGASPTPSEPSEIEFVKGKNLLPYANLSANPQNGITLTDNQDGTFTLNGTSTAQCTFILWQGKLTNLEGEYVTLSGCPSGGNNYTTYHLQYWNSISSRGDRADVGYGTTFEIPTQTNNGNIAIIVRSGQTLNNLTFKPMLQKGCVVTKYLPYNTIAIETKNGNLLNLNDLVLAQIGNNISNYNIIDNNTIKIDMNGSGTYASTWFYLNLPNGTYKLSYKVEYDDSIQGKVGLGVDVFPNGSTTRSSWNEVWITTEEILANVEKTITFSIDNSNYYYKLRTFNTQATAYQQNITFKEIHIEPSSQTSDFILNKSETYPLSLGDVELCKMGDYQDNIGHIKGINLFKTDYIENGGSTINDSTNNYFTLTNKWADPFVSTTNTNTILKPNTKYTISCRFKCASRPSSFGANNQNRILSLYDGTHLYQLIHDDRKNTGVIGIWYDYSYTFTTPSTLNNYSFISYTYKDTNNTTTGSIEISNLQIEEGNQAHSFEPYGNSDDWYLKKEIGKMVLNGSESWRVANTNNYRYPLGINVSNINTSVPKTLILSDHFIANESSEGDVDYQYTNSFRRGDGNITIWFMLTKYFISSTTSDAILSEWKTWLGTNNVIVYYILANPTYTKITNQTLLSQLNALEGAYSYDGTTNISTTTNNLLPSLSVKGIQKNNFEAYSLKTYGIGDFTLDAWDNMSYQVDENTYKTLNSNTITYSGSIMGNYETKIPTKQQEITTNVVEDNVKSVKKFAKTEIDNVNAQISLKVGKNEVINSINLSTEGASIDANKISLNGKTINLTSDTINIRSNNFDVDTEGNLTCNEATMKGATFTGGDVTLYQDVNDNYDYPLQIYAYNTITSVTLNETYDLYKLMFTYPSSGYISNVVVDFNTPFLKFENNETVIEYYFFHEVFLGDNEQEIWEKILEKTTNLSNNSNKLVTLWDKLNDEVRISKQPSDIFQTMECTLINSGYSYVLNIIKYALTTTNGLTKLNANMVATKDIFLRDETQQYYFNGGGTSGTINTNMLINNLSGGFRVTNDASFYDSNYRDILANKVLWDGGTTGYLMIASQTATLSESISNQPHGIVLVWSAYSGGVAQNYHWHCDFIPKEFINLSSSRGYTSIMGGSKFVNIATKYVYINDTSITGNADNNATGTASGITYSLKR